MSDRQRRKDIYQTAALLPIHHAQYYVLARMGLLVVSKWIANIPGWKAMNLSKTKHLNIRVLASVILKISHRNY